MTSQAVFRGIRVTGFGPSSVLKFQTDLPALTPSKNQVLIRLHAAGVNPVDVYVREGKPGTVQSLPYTPGKDGAGVVEAVGEDVKDWRKGDRVYTLSGSGTYAEYALVEQQNVFKLSSKVSFEQGAR